VVLPVRSNKQRTENKKDESTRGRDNAAGFHWLSTSFRAITRKGAEPYLPAMGPVADSRVEERTIEPGVSGISGNQVIERPSAEGCKA